MEQEILIKHLLKLDPERQIRVYLNLINKYQRTERLETRLKLQSTIHCLNEIIQTGEEETYLPLINDGLDKLYKSIPDAISDLTDAIYFDATGRVTELVKLLNREEDSKRAMFV